MNEVHSVLRPTVDTETEHSEKVDDAECGKLAMMKIQQQDQHTHLFLTMLQPRLALNIYRHPLRYNWLGYSLTIKQVPISLFVVNRKKNFQIHLVSFQVKSVYEFAAEYQYYKNIEN